jgi:DNA-binding transcriptional MerR regulator
MASIKNLKKDINFVLGDIIEAVYLWEASTNNKNSKEGTAVVDNAIETFDDLIEKVNKKDVEDRSKHLKTVKQELEEKATDLVQQLNKLG